MRYRISIGELPVETIADGDSYADLVPDENGLDRIVQKFVKSRETAWDAYKQLYPEARKLRRAQVAVTIEEIE